MPSLDPVALIMCCIAMLSFYFDHGDKLPKFKRFLLPLAFFAFGVAFGRVSFVGTNIYVNLISEGRIAGAVIIIVLIILLAMFVLYFFVKKNDHSNAYLTSMVILLIGPSLVSSFSKVADNAIPIQDYFNLADIHEKNNDFDGAIVYFQRYSAKVNDQKIKDAVRDKIEKIKLKQLEKLK